MTTMTNPAPTTESTSGQESGTPGIRSVADLRRALDAGGQTPLLLDVRTDGEFEAGHVPGAVLLPLHRIQEGERVPVQVLRPVRIRQGKGERGEQHCREVQRIGGGDGLLHSGALGRAQGVG